LTWCKASSLTAAVARTLRGATYPADKLYLLSLTDGKKVEGWELSFFLREALASKEYSDLRSVMSDLEDWLERQG